MLLVIIGKSGSGKDSIVKEFEKNGWKRIVKYTNRPKRDEEIDGIDYHFVPIDVMIGKSFFFEESFTVANGDTWYYGISSEDLYRSLFTDKKNNYIIIMTPTEYKKLNKILFAVKGIDYISAQIDVPDDIRRERLIKRGDDMEEIDRRIKADNKDFESLKLKYRKEEFFPLFYIHDGIGDKTPEDIYNTIIEMMES